MKKNDRNRSAWSSHSRRTKKRGEALALDLLPDVEETLNCRHFNTRGCTRRSLSVSLFSLSVSLLLFFFFFFFFFLYMTLIIQTLYFLQTPSNEAVNLNPRGVEWSVIHSLYFFRDRTFYLIHVFSVLRFYINI